MKKPREIKFKTKRGLLTAYEFKCGYIEKKTKGQIETTIWQYGATSHYNIRRHDFENHNRIFWETAHTIKEARKIANRK